ncbi:MAG TPA: MBL fold hydrolase [Dehalococcoidia bacterium]|nr:MBL fold hydrolase [Dehalococcoidia bacterium]
MSVAPSDQITFVGTAGARIMVTRQLLPSGGAWLNLGGTEILIDPGPGCLVHTVRRKLSPAKLSAIILSHKHLDHSGDMNVMIEAMTDGGFKRRGVVFAPGDALGSEPVVFSYLRNFPERVEVLKERGSYSIGDISFTTPVRHIHGVETYGFVFQTPRQQFSWITDTKYFDALSRYYKSDVVIINVVRLESCLPIDHLSLDDARQIITEIKPKIAILTHFGMPIWKAGIDTLAARLSQETGTMVIGAKAGMTFDLNALCVVSKNSLL